MLDIKNMIKEDEKWRILRGLLEGNNVLIEICASNDIYEQEQAILK